MSQENNANSVTVQKNALRKLFRQRRKEIPAHLRLGHHQKITHHLDAALVSRDSVQKVAIYLATADEVDLETWIRSAWELGKNLAAPVVGKAKGQMSFFPLATDTPIYRGRFALREPYVESGAQPIDPTCFDAVLVPLLGFDSRGHRLGMGGGYYDRCFADQTTRPWIIGIAYDVQMADKILPSEPWDVALDTVVTETGFRHFLR